MAGKFFLHPAAIGVSNRKSSLGGLQRHQPICIHGQQRARQLATDRPQHTGVEEAGEVVSNNRRGLLGQGFDQSPARTCSGFYVGIV